MEYEDYGEYEYELNELVNAIKSSEEEKLKNRMKCLEDNNVFLRKELEKYKKIEKDIDEFKDELMKQYEQKIIDFRSKSIEELIGEKFLETIIVQGEYIKSKKCGKCDNQRKIFFKTPLGKETFEYCDCDREIKFFVPKKTHVKEISFNVNNTKSTYLYEFVQERNVEYELYDRKKLE